MKYVVSKSKIARDIVPIIQKYIEDNKIQYYIEPFCGGCNIIDKIKCENKYAFDIDKSLITLYLETINNEKLLDKLPRLLSKEHYYEVRDDKENKYPQWYKSAILFFGSYNARAYGGCYGGYANLGTENFRNYFLEALNNYKKQIPNLKDINFGVADYKELKLKNCLIYCDPPYANTIGYSTKFNHQEFWQWVRKMSENNIMLVSEYKAPEDFKCIWQKGTKTHINNRNKIDKIEKLFIYENSNPIKIQYSKAKLIDF